MSLQNGSGGQSSLELALSLPMYASVIGVIAAALINLFIKHHADYLVHESLVCQVSAADEAEKLDCQERLKAQLQGLPCSPKVDLQWDISSDEAVGHLNLTFSLNLAGGIEWHIKVDRSIGLPLTIKSEEET